MTNLDQVKILLVGDTGVGKSSLLHLICHGKTLSHVNSTVGCLAEVKLYQYNGRSYFVEFLEIGGSPKYSKSRSLFYTQKYDGIILVFDLTNKKSYLNLKKWMRELSHSVDSDESTPKFITLEKPDLEMNGMSLPVLLVGNKKDIAKEISGFNYTDIGFERINVSATEAQTFDSSSTTTKFNVFIDKVIERKHNGKSRKSPLQLKIDLPAESPDQSSYSSMFWRKQRIHPQHHHLD